MVTILLFCNGKAAIPTIHYLHSLQYKMYVVVDSDDKGKDTWQPSLKKYCQKNNILFISPINYTDKEFIRELRTIQPTVIFSIQCKQIIKKEIINIVNGEIFNFHFADLPKNRGCYPGIWHLRNGDRYVGVTLHKLTEGIDDGPIIDKVRKKITIADTGQSVYEWSCNQVLPLFRRNLKHILAKKYLAVEQDSSQANYYSRNSITFTNLFVDWNQKIFLVSRYIQAFIFQPFQFPKTRYGTTEINITGVVKVTKKSRETLPGSILSAKKGNIEVQAKDGSIMLSIADELKNIKPGEYFYL